MGITIARGQMGNTILQSGALKDVNFWQTDKSRTTIYLFGIVKKTIMETKHLAQKDFLLESTIDNLKSIKSVELL